MKLLKKILLVLTMSLFNYPLSAQVQSKSFKVLLKTLLSGDTPIITVPDAAKSANTFLFIDTREQEEYQVSHIKNAVFVGYKNIDLSSLQNIDKEKALVIYCSIGKRSEDITKKLRKEGFTNVKNLYGGIFEWVNQGHPVYDHHNKKTDRVHAYGRFWGQWLDKGTKVY